MLFCKYRVEMIDDFFNIIIGDKNFRFLKYNDNNVCFSKSKINLVDIPDEIVKEMMDDLLDDISGALKEISHDKNKVDFKKDNAAAFHAIKGVLYIAGLTGHANVLSIVEKSLKTYKDDFNNTECLKMIIVGEDMAKKALEIIKGGDSKTYNVKEDVYKTLMDIIDV